MQYNLFALPFVFEEIESNLFFVDCIVIDGARRKVWLFVSEEHLSRAK